MKHGYGNLGAVPVSGTTEVWVQLRYPCMHTPDVPDFFQKKKIPSTGWSSTDETESSQNLRSFQAKNKTHSKNIWFSLSLYHPPSNTTLTRFSLSLTSSAYRGRSTMSSDLDLRQRKISGVLRFGLAASFFLSGFLVFSLGIFLTLRWAWRLKLPSLSAFLFKLTLHISLSLFMFHSQ